MKDVLVTGAAGFVGRHVVSVLADRGVGVVALDRGEGDALPSVRWKQSAITPTTDWAPLFADVDAVVHLADGLNRLEQPEHRSDCDLADRLIAASAALARAAAGSRVASFVQVSSIKAMAGEQAPRPLDGASEPAPAGLYGRSKLELEKMLSACFAGTATRLVILRTPVIYGPGGKGNFARLLRLSDTGLPLPCCADATRSIIFVGNLADAIAAVLGRPEAEGVFYLQDRPPMPLKAVLATLREGLGRPTRLVPVPRLLWSVAMAAPTPLRKVARRLGGSLTVSDDGFAQAFGWQPPVTTRDALLLTADAYRRQRHPPANARPGLARKSRRSSPAPDPR